MRKENFDDSVKRILEQAEFAYDPAAWEQAQALLANEPKRRLGGWWWTLLLLAVSSIVGAGISGIQERQPQTKQEAIGPKKVIERPISQIKATSAHAGSSVSLPATNHVDSIKQNSKIPVRLYHQSDYTTAPPADTNIVLEQALDVMKQREINSLTSLSYTMKFADGLRTLPAYDFNYESRPAQLKRQGSLVLFAWAGQQGRNTESNLRQQQYGLGLALGLELLPRLELQLGTALAYHNGFAYTSTRSDTIYGFGRTITTQTASVNDYLQLQLPLGINYRLANKHRLELGAAYHHYLGSRYRLQTDIQSDGVPNSTRSSSMKGKIDGLSLADWSWYAGYRFILTDAFELGLRYQRQNAAGLGFPAENSFRVVVHYHPYRFGL